MEKHTYSVNVKWIKERRGIVCAPDISSILGAAGCIEVATPPQFDKGIAGVWSPEHLYAASIGSCFWNIFLVIAENSNLDFKAFSCFSSGTLEQLDRKFLMTEVILEPEVTITHAKDWDRTVKILQKSEAGCLISNSINSVVIMKPIVKIYGEEALG